MSSPHRLAFIGGGNMAEALLGGIVADLSAADCASIAVVETIASRRDYLHERFPHVHVLSTLSGPTEAAVIAVKPNDVEAVCRSLTTQLVGPQRVLSIAAGVTISQLEQWLGGAAHVIRSMPNTPAMVGQGATGLAGGTAADQDDLNWALDLLGKVGVAVQVPESKLDAVTGLSGSGPAYVFLVAEALIEAGVLVGLPRDTAEKLAKQTLLGAATLLAQPGADAGTLRANVTSPGGTTAAGLRALEQHGVRAAFMDAVAAATNRAHELAGGA
jgi:pyrroline-5-carboxylate reductase